MSIKKVLVEALKDNNRRYKLQYFVTFIILAIVSMVMTIVNIKTKQHLLTYVTLAFSLLSIVNVFLIYINNVTYYISKAIFAIEIISLFSYFIVSGQPEGFSVIWSLMLPSLGLLLFGLKQGTLLSTLMFVVIVTFFWIPAGQNILLYEYNSTFMLRFPFAYIAFYFVGLLFELMRGLTFANYHFFYTHDSLTGAYNRVGYLEYMNTIDKHDSNVVEYVMFDIDKFKAINDTYGHPCGDVILRDVVRVVEEKLGAPICRFGGEEFLAFFPNASITKEHLDKVREAIEKNIFQYDDNIISVTISIGAIVIKRRSIESGIDPLKVVDNCLYDAKNSGRNCLKFTSIEEQYDS